MKYLFRGLAAGAAGLLLSAGLAAPASAAAANCTLSVNDPAAIAEGDEGPTPGAFTVTATASDASDPCNGVVVDYTFGGTAANGSDYTGTNGQVTFGSVANGASATQEIPFSVLGDNFVDAGETITVTIEPATAGPTVSKASGSTTITDDDTIGIGGALTSSPASGPEGTVINVSGTQCNAATADIFFGSNDGSSGGPVESTRKTVNVNADKTFAGTITVPAGSDPNRNYTVHANCGTAADPYAFNSFDVTPTAASGTGGDGEFGQGYRMVAGDGGIFTFGDRQFHGSTGDRKLNKPIVGGATDVSDYNGYWIVAADGGVFTFNAPFYGSLGDQVLSSTAAEIEPVPTGTGYYIVLADGKVYTFGTANHFGDMSGKQLNQPIIGMSVTPTGKGYWLVGADGGIFNFGDADFFGSTGAMKLNAPIIDLAPSVDNNGYYLLGADGGVFTFGSAQFKGSTGAMKLNAPVVAMLVNPSGTGYWLAASDGGVFTFGDNIDFLGSMGGIRLNSPVLYLIY